MQCRRRKPSIKGIQTIEKTAIFPDEEIPPSILTATSKSHYLWPFSFFQASNVLEPNDYYWNAGGFSPATIHIDIGGGGAAAYITRIVLEAVMVPVMGKVRHEVRLGLTPDTMHTVYWYTGVTVDGECLTIQLVNSTDDLRRRSKILEIITHESPSWVAWRRIRVWKASM